LGENRRKNVWFAVLRKNLLQFRRPPFPPLEIGGICIFLPKGGPEITQKELLNYYIPHTKKKVSEVTLGGGGGKRRNIPFGEGGGGEGTAAFPPR